MHSRGFDAVNLAPSFKVAAWPRCASFARRDTQEEEEKINPAPAASNQQRPEVENVVVNGTQVIQTKPWGDAADG